MMASVTASRSLSGSWVQTCWLATVAMVVPAGCGHSLEGRHQLFNGGQRQHGRVGTWLSGEVGAGDGQVAEEAREDLDVAVPDVPRQGGDARELQRSSRLLPPWRVGNRK